MVALCSCATYGMSKSVAGVLPLCRQDQCNFRRPADHAWGQQSRDTWDRHRKSSRKSEHLKRRRRRSHRHKRQWLECVGAQSRLCGSDGDPVLLNTARPAASAGLVPSRQVTHWVPGIRIPTSSPRSSKACFPKRGRPYSLYGIAPTIPPSDTAKSKRR